MDEVRWPKRECHLNLNISWKSWSLRRAVVWMTSFLFLHINNITFLFARGESESNKLAWKSSTFQWVDGISMHWESYNVWHQPRRLMNLPPVSSTAQGAWCDGRGPTVFLLCVEWERPKVSDHGNNAGPWVCLWSFFLITWPSTTSFDALQESNLTNMRWVPTKYQTPCWVLLVGKVWLFPFYIGREWGSERRSVLPKVTELDNKWI